MLRNQNIQNALASKITNYLSDKLKTHVSVKNVKFDFFNRLVMNDFYLEDQRKDTLLYSKKLTIAIDVISFRKRIIRIDELQFYQPYIHFFSDSLKNLNLNFIINQLFGSHDTTKRKWEILFNDISFGNGRFCYEQEIKKPVKYGIDFSNVKISELYLRVKNLHIEKDTVIFKINWLSFKEKSGFEILNLSALMSMSKKHIHYKNLRILTEKSNIFATNLNFDFPSFKNFPAFLIHANLNSTFRKSKVSFEDLSYFLEKLHNVKLQFTIDGILNGKISNLKGKEIVIKNGDSTSFEGNINLIGLPNIKETYIYLDCKRFSTNTNNIETILTNLQNNHPFKFPKFIKNTGELTYKGVFTGFINDFVAYGTLISNLGIIKTGISIKPDEKHEIILNGKLISENLDLGTLLNKKELFGKTNFELNINVSINDKNKLSGNLQGFFHSLEFKNYNYSNISLEGKLNNNAYDGSLKIDDKNLQMEMLGYFDFSKNNPDFDFTTNVIHSDLAKLNFIKKDTAFKLSCLLTANFKGNKIENFDGKIDLINGTLQHNLKTLNLSNISIHSNNNKGYKLFTVNSEIADAQVEGQFESENILITAKQFLKTYLRSTFNNIEKPANYKNTNIKFNIKLKNTDQVFEFFKPSISLANNSSLSGVFNYKEQLITFNGNSLYMKSGSSKFYDVTLSGKSSDSLIQITVSTSNYSVADQINFNKLNTTVFIGSDSIKLKTEWQNPDSLKSLSTIYSKAFFKYTSINSKPIFNYIMYPSTINLLDSLWTLDESHLTIDSTSISIDGFKVSHNNQMLQIFGKISEDPIDSLKFIFNNFDINNLNFLFKSATTSIKGSIFGTTVLNDYYKKCIFDNNIRIKNLTINNEVFGNSEITAKWSNEDRKLNVNALAQRGTLKTVEINGEYIPDTKSLSFLVHLDKFKLSIFKSYFKNVFSNLYGYGSGDMTLSGTLQKPVLDGEMMFQKAGVTVNFLKTTYTFTSPIKITNNTIIFSEIKLSDENGNSCLLNGSITNNYFKNLSLNILLNPHNLISLNTTSADNNLFYGKVYASGLVSITGTLKNISIDIAGKTEKNTVFYILLNRRGNITENYFLNFIKKDSIKLVTQTDTKPEFKTNLSGLLINIDLEVTPDAEIQLIFDQKIGDILRGKGKGNIKMEIDPAGKSFMYGDYTVSEGDYLFTLKNVINKKFTVEKGGTISWNGNPTDANIDIMAVYHTRAPLYNLLMFENATDEYKRRIPVDCRINLTGKLQNPLIKYDIFLPTTDEETKNKVKDVISNEEELSRQFLSLLVINNFFPENQGSQSDAAQAASTASLPLDIAATTSYELLSNQLTNWMSQLSKDFDIGINYRPGEQNITSNEVEVALSTQLLNDRVSINGNFDVSGTQVNQTTGTPKNNPNNLVGDFNVDVKLTDNIHFKAFNRVNDQTLYEQQPYTQGIGLSYREEFTSFADLKKKFLKKLKFHKPKTEKE